MPVAQPFDVPGQRLAGQRLRLVQSAAAVQQARQLVDAC